LRSALTALPASVAVGLSFYPNMDNGGAIEEPADLSPCINTEDNVAVALLGPAGSDQRAALATALDEVEVNPQGATPTHDAYLQAIEDLASTGPQGNRYVVLLTDGQPTLLEGCYGRAAPRTPEDYQPIVDAIAVAYGEGIRTFVIGAPGSEANQGTGEDVRYWLSEAARAGGTARPDCSDAGPTYCHFDMTEDPDFGAGLSGALGTISGEIATCQYTLPDPPAGETLDLGVVNVVYTTGGQEYLVRRNAAPTCDRGWHLTADGTLELCGETCDTVQGDAEARVELLFGCAAVYLIE
jgi:hypothetical protein